MSRIRLGDMLVAARIVEPAQIDQALATQKERGGRLGEILVELGLVSEVQLAQVLSNQLSIPWVNLYHVEFSRELLNLIPAEVAERYGVIPVYVRKVRKEGDTLFVATDDPTNDVALSTIAQHAALPVKPMVASSSDVRNAIRVYYFGGRPTAATAPKKKSIRPPPAIASIPPVELDMDDESARGPKAVAIPKAAAVPREPGTGAAPREGKPGAAPMSAARGSPAPGAAGAPGARPAAASGAGAATGAASGAAASGGAASGGAPAPAGAGAAPGGSPERRAAPKKKAKMITMTLLDGTVVSLPVGGKKAAEEPADESLTTRDLIAALVARAEGKDVSAILPEGKWEPIFAALLAILLRKGLMADWEFVEEWSKHKR
jgi:type IV pilus assembly protein PilB